MPLWQIYHPEGTFADPAEQQAIAQDITKTYTELELPAFYVVTNFIQLPNQNIWVGGKQKTDKPFIRIVITHIALHVPDNQGAVVDKDAVYKRTTSRIDMILKPHVGDKGYDWEYHVQEMDRRLWKINGLIPPQPKSEAEKLWFNENRAVVYDGAYP